MLFFSEKHICVFFTNFQNYLLKLSTQWHAAVILNTFNWKIRTKTWLCIIYCLLFCLKICLVFYSSRIWQCGEGVIHTDAMPVRWQMTFDMSCELVPVTHSHYITELMFSRKEIKPAVYINFWLWCSFHHERWTKKRKSVVCLKKSEEGGTLC
jgi:hypothetical protein